MAQKRRYIPAGFLCIKIISNPHTNLQQCLIYIQILQPVNQVVFLVALIAIATKPHTIVHTPHKTPHCALVLNASLPAQRKLSSAITDTPTITTHEAIIWTEFIGIILYLFYEVQSNMIKKSNFIEFYRKFRHSSGFK